jgi:hypothetical protein
MRILPHVFSVVLMSACCSLAIADQVVVTAIPNSKVISSSTETLRYKLSDDERTKALLVIHKTPEGYRWSTREDRELVMRTSGAFALFIDPSGGGYVKVATVRGAAALSDDSCKEGFAYFEHLSLGIATLTYWGCATELQL